jgi:hypothetical protein
VVINKSELSIDSSPITRISLNYSLSFWDRHFVATGEECNSTPANPCEEKCSESKNKEFLGHLDDGLRVYIPLKDGRFSVLSRANFHTATMERIKTIFGSSIHATTPSTTIQSSIKLHLRNREINIRNSGLRDPVDAMAYCYDEALFPYIRGSYRLVLSVSIEVLVKAAKLRELTILHSSWIGFSEGDFTPAAYANLGDEGLLVMDNKEQATLSQEFIDLLLFHSTGAELGSIGS